MRLTMGAKLGGFQGLWAPMVLSVERESGADMAESSKESNLPLSGECAVRDGSEVEVLAWDGTVWCGVSSWELQVGGGGHRASRGLPQVFVGSQARNGAGENGRRLPQDQEAVQTATAGNARRDHGRGWGQRPSWLPPPLPEWLRVRRPLDWGVVGGYRRKDRQGGLGQRQR